MPQLLGTVAHVDVSRRQMLALLGGSIGLGYLFTACRSALESATHSVATATTAASHEESNTAITTPPAPEAVPQTTSSTGINPPSPITSPASPETLAVIAREGWSFRQQGAFRSHQIERITIHHTAAEITDNSRAPALIRQHEDWHMSHGWPGLAYHFIIDRAGNVYEGRPISAIGDTFTEYDPTGHLLASFEGHFDRQSPSDAQLAGMTRLVAWAMQTYSVPAQLIGGHRDWARTTCPGSNMYWRLGGLARAAADHGTVELGYLRNDAAIDRVAQISAGQ